MKFDYDDLNRVTGERWYTNLADTTANHTSFYSYDHLGRTTSQGD